MSDNELTERYADHIQSTEGSQYSSKQIHQQYRVSYISFSRGNGKGRSRCWQERGQSRFSSYGRYNNVTYNQLDGLPQRNCWGRINGSGTEFQSWN